MATFTLDEYPNELRRKKKAISHAGIKSARTAAYYIETQAKLMAPRGKDIPKIGYKGGETFDGIDVVRKNRTKYVVSSVVSGKRRGFLQNMWANQTAPFRSNKRMGVYGVEARDWTGKPRFFHFAALRAQDRFKKITRANIRRALRINVG